MVLHLPPLLIYQMMLDETEGTQFPEEEEGKEEALSLMWDSLPNELGSVVGVESISDYPHLCGSGHTPLLSPATITEKGVELGCVIGLHATGGHETILSLV